MSEYVDDSNKPRNLYQSFLDRGIESAPTNRVEGIYRLSKEISWWEGQISERSRNDVNQLKILELQMDTLKLKLAELKQSKTNNWVNSSGIFANLNAKMERAIQLEKSLALLSNLENTLSEIGEFARSVRNESGLTPHEKIEMIRGTLEGYFEDEVLDFFLLQLGGLEEGV